MNNHEGMLINDEAQMANDDGIKMTVIPSEVEESRSGSSRAVPQDRSTSLRMSDLATDLLFVIHSSFVIRISSF
jgi:hypothetical protein